MANKKWGRILGFVDSDALFDVGVESDVLAFLAISGSTARGWGSGVGGG